jgi:hypothetical protein
MFSKLDKIKILECQISDLETKITRLERLLRLEHYRHDTKKTNQFYDYSTGRAVEAPIYEYRIKITIPGGEVSCLQQEKTTTEKTYDLQTKRTHDKRK